MPEGVATARGHTAGTVAAAVAAAAAAAALGFFVGLRSRPKEERTSRRKGKGNASDTATTSVAKPVSQRRAEIKEAFAVAERAAAELAANAHDSSAGKPGRQSTTQPTQTRTGGLEKEVKVCECGVRLSDLSPEDCAAHMTSQRHRRNLVQLRKRCSEVVVCEEVGEYRAAATQLVRPDDCVLEVGCHVGGTTKVLLGLTSNIVGLDQQPDLIAQARERLPSIHFEVGDAFDAHRVLQLAHSQKAKRFHKVFIDISGSRDLATVIRLIDIYENTLRPEVIVVKSQALKRLLLRAQLWIEHPESFKNVNGASRKAVAEEDPNRHDATP